MRPFKLGLSKPKAKKKEAVNSEENTESKMNDSEVDEINVSRETITGISDSQLKRAVKVEPKTISEHSVDSIVQEDVESQSILDLVDKISNNIDTMPLKAAEVYDMQNDYVPEAGPSKIHSYTVPQPDDSFIHYSDSSLEENNTGIMSFYSSKLFNLSLECNENTPKNKQAETHEIKVKIENYDQNELIEDVMIPDEKVSNFERLDSSLKIITPKIKPPSGNYIAATLKQYKIPKIVYPAPFYSDHKDVGAKVEVGQLVLKLHSRSARHQKPFERVTDTSLEEWRRRIFMQTNEMFQESTKPDSLRTLLAGNKACVLEPVKRPPTNTKVKQWIQEKAKTVVTESRVDDSKNIDELDNSQALGLIEDVIDNSISLESNDKVI